MKDKKIVLIAITILVMLIILIQMPKLFLNNKEEEIPEVKLKEIEKSKSFAIMVPNDSGNGYTSYDKNEWPTSDDDYYYVKSECIDNNGNKVENAISYNEENNTASLTTNSTVYCTLYFDKYNYMKVPLHEVSYGGSTASVPTYMSSKVKHVEFVDYIEENLNFGDKNTTWWDLSDTSQGTKEESVIAWVDQLENDNGFYTLYIGSKAKIRATSLDSAFMVSEYGENFGDPITNLEQIDFNNILDTSKTTSFSVSFAWNDKLTQINGTENWDTSKVTIFFATFVNCNALSDFNFIKNWQITNNVITLETMFGDCHEFDNLNLLQNWDVSKVKSTVNMFCNCTSLTDISPIHEWNTSNLTNMQSMFQGCTNLVDINGISNWNVSNVTNMRTMFYGCTSLQNINLSTWDTKNVINVEGMFSNCTKLNTLNMSNATFTQIQDSNNYQNMFYNVPTAATIIVKDEGQKNWLWTNKDTLGFTGTEDNIKISNEI